MGVWLKSNLTSTNTIPIVGFGKVWLVSFLQIHSTITGQQLFSLFGSCFFENVVEVFEGLSRDELVVVAGGHGLDGFDDFGDVKRLSQSVKRSLSVDDNRQNARFQWQFACTKDEI